MIVNITRIILTNKITKVDQRGKHNQRGIDVRRDAKNISLKSISYPLIILIIKNKIKLNTKRYTIDLPQSE
jgi:hypothetical protein